MNESVPIVTMQPLERFFRIPGDAFTGLVDFYLYAQVAGKIGAEIGCARGESGEIAAQFLGHLYCVDPFGEWFEANEPFFHERMASIRNVTKVKKESHVACHDFADESLDIVYIDASHDYENVKRDILCWFPKVKMNGWIGGHDYDFVIDAHKEVVQAVNEILGIPEMRFVDDSFLFRKTPDLVERVNREC